MLLLTGCASSPIGVRGEEADRAASQMLAAVNASAWEQTGAVRWDFDGRARHLWDRRRGFSRVEWSDVRALIDLDRRVGRAFEEGVEVTGEDAIELLDSAHAKWINDAFWLNPLVKVFDPGTERELLEEDHATERGLIVRFTSGGRTPGDVYLFWLGIDGTPTRWQMWTSNLPFKGVEASWDDWIRLPTGARISTKHETFLIDIDLIGVDGAYTLGQLEPGPDPFAELLECGDRCVSF